MLLPSSTNVSASLEAALTASHDALTRRVTEGLASLTGNQTNTGGNGNNTLGNGNSNNNSSLTINNTLCSLSDDTTDLVSPFAANLLELKDAITGPNGKFYKKPIFFTF